MTHGGGLDPHFFDWPTLVTYAIDLTDIDWVIAGGESGPRARPMDIAWGRELRDQLQRLRHG